MNVPQQLGPYRRGRKLGHGGMCQVFEARTFGASGFERRVALKVLLPELMGRAEYERALIKEASLGARLHHQNLVSVLDFGVEQGISYLCMELVDGLDLRRMCAEARPAPEVSAWITAELARGLAHLHGASDERGHALGLVHRDVNPSNVLISGSGEVRLSDFGVIKATRMRHDTRGNVRKGTYAYMSPEQVRADELTFASDLFSLGIVFVELLTGQRPFDGVHAFDTLQNIESGELPGLDAVPDHYRELTRTMLAPDPADRLASAERVHQALLDAGVASPFALRDWARERIEAHAS